MQRRLIAAVICSTLIATLSVATAANAQTDFPTKRITVLVPYPAGGIVDIATRIVTDEVSKTLGQPIVVENKPGANTNIATALAARSAPDGYTWTYIGPATLANPRIYSDLAWSEKSFDALGMTAFAPQAVIVNPALPPNTLAEFIELARKSPGALNYANFGVGSATHLNAAMLMVRTNTTLTMVPYRGQPPAITDIITDRINVMVGAAGLVSEHFEAKKLKVLAVFSEKRLESLPGVPTLAELGYPDINVVPWYGLAAPKGTPKPIVTKINAAINAAVSKPEIRALMIKQSLIAPDATTAEEFAARIEKDAAEIGRIVAAANIKIGK